MKRLIFIILLGVALALLFRRFCFEMVYIATASMEPTFKVEQEVIVNKLAYIFKGPKRNDIVLLESPVSGKGLIKRIVGLPGETISIKEKKVYIDGKPLDEDYVQYKREGTILVGDNIEPFPIPRNHYFVMGDNRDVSRDSRDWFEDDGLQTATVPGNKIKGKVVSLY